MEPNNRLNQNDPTNPYAPNAGRPMNDFGPARPQRPTQQRPMNDFAPRPATPQRPAQGFNSPQPPNMQRPANLSRSFPQMQNQKLPATHQPAGPQQTAKPMTFEPPKKKRKIGFKKVLSVSTVALLLIACSYVFIATGDEGANKSSAKAHSNQPSIKPLESTGFTTYYPSPLPPGLKPMKGSITYYKDSFTFILEQNGQKSFFIYEQPASTDPDFNSLKSKLAAPKNIALTVGQGVEGGLDNGTVTAVKTDKNTILMVDCIKAVCSTTAHDILSNMQVNNDLEALRKSNP
jgi:hypothetical protein